MSTQPPDREYPDSPYRRDDWHGTPDIETAGTTHRSQGTTWPTRTRRQEKAAHVAHHLLRGVAPALCAVTCADPSRVPVELTEPGYYPHGEESIRHLRAVRANETDGYLSDGESTAVMLDGVPTEMFFDLVAAWLDYCEREGHIGPDLRDELYADAQSMKQGTDKPDEEIVAILVGDVLAGERSSP